MTLPPTLALAKAMTPVCLGLAVLCGVPSARAESPRPGNSNGATSSTSSSALEGPQGEIVWLREGAGRIGDRAEIDIPSGFRFGGQATTVAVLRAFGNIPDGSELALIGTEDLEWFVVYDFSEIGYVLDDEKDALDAEGLIEAFQYSAAEENKIRQDMGLAIVEVVGWSMVPTYLEDRHVLEWATRLQFTEPGGATSQAVNYKTKVLGRKGVMNVVVVCNPDQLQTVLPKYQSLMEGFRFIEGERYQEFESGDKVAEAGLSALVVGDGVQAEGSGPGSGSVEGESTSGWAEFFKHQGKILVLAVAGFGALLVRLLLRRRG